MDMQTKLTWVTRTLVLMAVIAWPALGGCATTGSGATADLGPPPEGYEDWDDYWKDQDHRYRAFERDRQKHEMDRQRLPGGQP